MCPFIFDENYVKVKAVQMHSTKMSKTVFFLANQALYIDDVTDISCVGECTSGVPDEISTSAPVSGDASVPCIYATACTCWQSMKTYQLYHGELLQAESKLRHAENQRIKVEQQQNAGGVVGAKTAISRRFRNYEKLSEKVCQLTASCDLLTLFSAAVE